MPFYCLWPWFFFSVISSAPLLNHLSHTTHTCKRAHKKQVSHSLQIAFPRAHCFPSIHLFPPSVCHRYKYTMDKPLWSEMNSSRLRSQGARKQFNPPKRRGRRWTAPALSKPDLVGQSGKVGKLVFLKESTLFAQVASEPRPLNYTVIGCIACWKVHTAQNKSQGSHSALPNKSLLLSATQSH